MQDQVQHRGKGHADTEATALVFWLRQGGGRALPMFGSLEAELKCPKRRGCGVAFPLTSPSQVWAEEQTGRSAGGMLFCKGHRESEDRAFILPLPQLRKRLPCSEKKRPECNTGNVTWVGQPPSCQLGRLQRLQAAVLFPGAYGPLGFSFPPSWGKGHEGEQTHRPPGERPT